MHGFAGGRDEALEMRPGRTAEIKIAHRPRPDHQGQHAEPIGLALLVAIEQPPGGERREDAEHRALGQAGVGNNAVNRQYAVPRRHRSENIDGPIDGANGVTIV